MPELPEVQTVVMGMNKTIKSLVISDVWTDYKSDFYIGKDSIKDPAFFKKFKKNILGQKILKAERRAKNILIHLSNKKTIIVHLKMTGHFLFGDYSFNKKENCFFPEKDYFLKKEFNKDDIEKEPLRDPFNRFIHFVITFENKKRLALSDMRKFASITLIETSLVKSFFEKIGPEPFGLKIKDLNINRFRNGKIKTVLMNPEFIAGIGNIYSDEILWEVGIHPETLVKNITDKKFKEILKFSEKILKSSINIGGDSMSDFRNIEGRKGKFQNKHNCYKLENTICKKKNCNGILEKKVIGGRVARYCLKHQSNF